MNYKDKQAWIESVMASDQTPAVKVYAYGIFQHMYGNKDDAFPGAKALEATTGLHRSKFYKYNQALAGAGFLRVTPRRGTSNEYHLQGVPPNGSRGSSQKEEGFIPQGVGVTPTGSTNTTKKTTSKTTSEDNNTVAVADAPAPASPNSVVRESGTDYMAASSNGFEDSNEVTPTGRNLEQLSKEQRGCAYNAAVRKRELATVQTIEGDW